MGVNFFFQVRFIVLWVGFIRRGVRPISEKSQVQLIDGDSRISDCLEPHAGHVDEEIPAEEGDHFRFTVTVVVCLVGSHNNGRFLESVSDCVIKSVGLPEGASGRWEYFTGVRPGAVGVSFAWRVVCEPFLLHVVLPRVVVLECIRR